MANVFASAAAYEMEIRSACMLAGQAAARQNEVIGGGSKAVRQFTVTAAQKPQVISMRGEMGAAIARTVRLSRPTVYRLFRQNLNSADEA